MCRRWPAADGRSTFGHLKCKVRETEKSRERERVMARAREGGSPEFLARERVAGKRGVYGEEGEEG